MGQQLYSGTLSLLRLYNHIASDTNSKRPSVSKTTSFKVKAFSLQHQGLRENTEYGNFIQ